MNNNPKKLITIRCSPSNDAKMNLMYLQEVGYLPADFAGYTRQDAFDSYLISFVLKGRGSITAKGTEYRLCEGQCLFTECNSERIFKCDTDEPWEMLWLHFNGNSAPYYYELFAHSEPCVFMPQSINDFASILFQIIANNGSETPNSEIINAKLITDIITKMISNPSVYGPVDTYRSQMKSVKDYIDIHFTEDINLDGISEAFYINKYYLTREFKKEYHETIFQHIINRRIEYAKELLLLTDKTIEEITFLSGFNDQSYFSRQFKKIVGITSLNYRRMKKNYR